jgi:DUF1680 family protein
MNSGPNSQDSPAQGKHSRYRKLVPLAHDAVRWTRGFWADRFQLCRETILPSMRQAMDDPDNAAWFGNFCVAAGLQEGTHQGTFWSDGDCYKWMEAAAHVYGITHDADLDRALDELIEVIAQAQDPDGYICTQIQLTDRERWQRRNHHELYNMGHLLTSACVHHQVTGKDSFLVVATRLADYLYDLFASRPRKLVHYGWNPSNIMGLVDLYRTTDDLRYLELAQVFVDMRGAAPEDFSRIPGWVLRDGGDQNQDRVPLRKETQAVGHGVTATYLWCGAADVYAETGELVLLEALERIWDDVTTNKLYVTGALGALHHGASPRGDPVHEAFGLPYQLPNATAYNETCTNIGNAMWNWRLLNLTAKACYADGMEQVIYNSMLSPMSADGTRFFYTNPLRWYGCEHQPLSHDAHERWFTHDCYCCPPQVARSIARLHNWAYSLSGEGVWVHLYGGSHLETELPDGEPLVLVQDTRYPWRGAIEITLERAPSELFSVMLRIPGWADGAEIHINGGPADTQVRPGRYAKLERVWSAGDVIELSLPMQTRLLVAHPKVEETRNQVAVARGPVVYCLESADLADGVDLAEVYVPREIEWTPRYDAELLGGIAVLKGQACRFRTRPDQGSLYHTLEDVALEPLPITLIPYYAWANRGIGKMSVWLPLC